MPAVPLGVVFPSTARSIINSAASAVRLALAVAPAALAEGLAHAPLSAQPHPLLQIVLAAVRIRASPSTARSIISFVAPAVRLAPPPLRVWDLPVPAQVRQAPLLLRALDPLVPAQAPQAPPPLQAAVTAQLRAGIPPVEAVVPVHLPAPPQAHLRVAVPLLLRGGKAPVVAVVVPAHPQAQALLLVPALLQAPVVQGLLIARCGQILPIWMHVA